MDIASLYESVMKERLERHKSSGGGGSQWRRDTIEDMKSRVRELDDEIWGIYKLNRECSWEHMCHVLVRNHIGDVRCPDEVWDYWLEHVKCVVENKKCVVMDGE